jgi:hypothetical protein
MNTGEEGLLTAPLLSVTVRLNVKVDVTVGATNVGVAHDELAKIGKYGESMNEFVKECIDVYEKMKK